MLHGHTDVCETRFVRDMGCLTAQWGEEEDQIKACINQTHDENRNRGEKGKKGIKEKGIKFYRQSTFIIRIINMTKALGNHQR